MSGTTSTASTELPLPNRVYKCGRCGRKASTNGPVNDWYHGCVDNDGHNWKEESNG